MNTNNEIKEVVLGGCSGAAFLGGIYAFFAIGISYMGGPIARWTFDGICIGFDLFAGAGLIIGAVLGWQNPKLIRRAFVPAICLGVPAILVGCFLYTMAIHVRVPRDVKLADCTNDIVHFQYEIPKGHNYSLVFVAPSGSTNTFSGHGSISDGASTITNFAFGSLQTDIPCSFLHAQSNYDMVFAFSGRPPSSMTIRFHWLQTHKEGE